MSCGEDCRRVVEQSEDGQRLFPLCHQSQVRTSRGATLEISQLRSGWCNSPKCFTSRRDDGNARRSRRPFRTDFLFAANQTLRVWLISSYPSGTTRAGRMPVVSAASTRVGNPESFRGWDFLSTPDTRLKPVVDENQTTKRGWSGQYKAVKIELQP